MLKLISLIVTLAFVCTCYSQEQYIGMNRFFIRKIWKSYARKDKLNILTTNSDTTIKYLIRDSTVRNVDMVFYFDKAGRCNKVEETFDCDSCFLKAFNKTLEKARLKWTKIMDDVYLSKYSKKLLLFKNPDALFSYIIQHNKYMTKEQYNSFLPKGSFNAQKLSQN